MAKSSVLNAAIKVGVGLMVLFLLFSTIVMPQFSSAWRYCQDPEWKCDHGTTAANCTTSYKTSNTTAVTGGGTDHTEEGETLDTETDSSTQGCDNFCVNCDIAGGYRATAQGLQLLILVIALIASAMYFLRRS